MIFSGRIVKSAYCRRNGAGYWNNKHNNNRKGRVARMARKAKGKKSNWKGGSFRAAVGGYLRKKVRRAGGRAKRGVLKGLKRCLWS